MTSMISLRLSTEQEQRLSTVAAASGMTRSDWLRMAIDRQLAETDSAVDPHAIYLELMAPLATRPGSGRADAARQHSQVLKRKLHAARHR
jgi:hypothetical protein